MRLKACADIIGAVAGVMPDIPVVLEGKEAVEASITEHDGQIVLNLGYDFGEQQIINERKERKEK